MTKATTVGSNKTSGKKKRWEEFGALLRAIRLRDNLTMEAVAEKAFGDPKQKGDISNLEKGKGSIAVERALALVKALARDEAERADLLVAFALHAGIVAVLGLDKSAIRRVIELAQSLQLEAKEAKKARRGSRSTVEAVAPVNAGSHNEPSGESAGMAL